MIAEIAAGQDLLHLLTAANQEKPVQTTTAILAGGLDLVSPLATMPPGRVTAALNYEPEAAGYRRLPGCERFDGRPAPSGASGATADARRNAIQTVPGSGDVRGVFVYDGAIYAWRDTDAGGGAMYRSSASGWQQVGTGNYEILFSSGSAEILEGETLVGGTSSATAEVVRVVLRSGSWSGGDAAGYIVAAQVSGAFTAETVSSTSGGAATITAPSAISIPPGGRYDAIAHNFYGALSTQRMYFANGVGNAFEWDGDNLCPIRTGVTGGLLDAEVTLLARNSDTILARGDDSIILRADYDNPNHVAHYRNHLFLGYEVGSVINSGIGEPLDYRASAGAGEYMIGRRLTGLIPAVSTALLICAEDRIAYLVGNDSSDFTYSPISERAGAYQWTAQLVEGMPLYLDDGGLRRLSATDALGDWRMGTVTQLVEPLVIAKRDAGVRATASVVVKAKDQYWLFFDDQTGIIVYFGRRTPEVMPFKLPFQVTCACAEEVDAGIGDRVFVGATNGYVYEIGKGNSFDGAQVDAYLRMAWANLGAPLQDKRFHKVTAQGDFPDDCTIGVTYSVDYAIPENPSPTSSESISVSAGAPIVTIDDYADIDWTQPTHGLVETYLFGIGMNCAVTFISNHTTEAPHTFKVSSLHFSPRGLRR